MKKFLQSGSFEEIVAAKLHMYFTIAYINAFGITRLLLHEKVMEFLRTAKRKSFTQQSCEIQGDNTKHGQGQFKIFDVAHRHQEVTGQEIRL